MAGRGVWPPTPQARICFEVTSSVVPCQIGDADLWFSEKRVDVERAKAMCAGCPIRRECLAAALHRHEPWGVWGGEIIERGAIAAGKRTRGRPRKNIEKAHSPSALDDMTALSHHSAPRSRGMRHELSR